VAASSGQWWVIAYTQVSGPSTYQYFQGTKAQAQAQANLAVKVGGSNVTGPFSTEADAKAAVASGKVNRGDQSQAQQAITAVGNALGGWNLAVSGIAGWFARALKVTLGGVLMIIGLSRLTGVDNKITQLAGKVPLPI
jgi:hypothetical protein